MSTTGRKRDSIWCEYTQLPENRAQCNHCKKEMAALVARMKKHFNEEHKDLVATSSQTPSLPKHSTQSTMDPHISKTTPDQKRKFDLLVAKYFYSSNTPFRDGENSEFKQMVHALHPGYSPPNRQQLGGPLLDAVYQDLKNVTKEKLKDKVVTLSVDCWSNVNNESILGFCVQDAEKTYIVCIKDVSDQSHTSEFLRDVVMEGVGKIHAEYDCTILGLVTDNAENMNKMRRLCSETNPFFIAYGCAAHQMNLLAHDLQPDPVIKKIVTIAKFFRNNQLASNWISTTEIMKKPPLPSEVRWSSALKLLDWYLQSWTQLKQYHEQNPNQFKKNPAPEVAKYLKDIILYKNVEDAHIALKPISDALDVMQSNSSTIADAVAAWKKLLDFYRERGSERREWLEHAEKRYNNSVPDSWLAAYLLCPEYFGCELTGIEMRKAIGWIKTQYPECSAAIVNFIGDQLEILRKEFEENGGNRSSFLKYQMTLGNLAKEIADVAIRLEKLAPSSAGLERMFSTMGFVQDELRNRLGIEKLEKLTFIKRVLSSS